MTTAAGRPIVFGEVLFDRFADGTAVLGGAPFNVAWHLQGLGLRPLFVSRVGDDAAGREVLETMESWGMDTAGVQVDPAHPTGVVQVSLDRGQPSYEIVPEQAYDFIDLDAARDVTSGGAYSLLYHGTLIARNQTSRDSLFELDRHLALPVFVDVNLRAPWWDAATLERVLANARWAKLNDHELQTLLGSAELSTHDCGPAAQSLCRRTDLELVVLTMGEAGACFADQQHVECAAPKPVSDLVDTVGAGDAFSAVTILGLTAGWPPQRILRRALGFAADVCRMRGATRADHGLYAAQWKQWDHDGDD